MQIAENYMKQVNEIIKNQISITSNQEEWNNIKALKATAEKKNFFFLIGIHSMQG